MDSATGVPFMETDTNTAAVHGFRNRSIGTVTSTWLELRGIADTGVISGNTNSYTLHPSYGVHDSTTRWHLDNLDTLRQSRVFDLTRNGQFIVVGLVVRRVGGLDSSVNGSEPVLKLRVRRQQRRDKDATGWGDVAALLGPVWIESQKQWVPAELVTATASGNQPFGTVATPWLRLTSIDDIAVMTRAWSDDDIVGTLFIERRSDGQRLNMNAVFRNQDGKVKRMAHTLLSDPQEQYRFILIPTGENLYPAQDVEITFESTMSFAKGAVRSIIDLRSMRETAAGTDDLVVYPNPANDELTIVVNISGDNVAGGSTSADRDQAHLRLFSLNGSSVHEQSCRLTDVLHVDLGTVPSGIYTVQVTTSTGTVITRRVVVMH